MVILASASPRRKELMKKDICSSFKIVVSDIDEDLSFKNHHEPIDIVKDISLRKCLKVAEAYPHDLVIAADTIVVIDHEIIGKPKDKEDAYLILKKLSGREHFVYTGYALKQEDKLVQGIVKSEVLFNNLTDDLIYRYIASGSPLDKAGAYGLQDNQEFPLVKKTSGSLTNIIGFPTAEIKNDLQKYFNLSE